MTHRQFFGVLVMSSCLMVLNILSADFDRVLVLLFVVLSALAGLIRPSNSTDGSWEEFSMIVAFLYLAFQGIMANAILCNVVFVFLALTLCMSILRALIQRYQTNQLDRSAYQLSSLELLDLRQRNMIIFDGEAEKIDRSD